MKKGTISYVLGSLSQLLNSVIGSGNRDQTFSARCWEGQLIKIKWCSICRGILDLIFFFEKNHCEESYKTDNEYTYED